MPGMPRLTTWAPFGSRLLRSLGQFCVAGRSAPVPNVSDAPIATKIYVGRCVGVSTTPGALAPVVAVDDGPNPQPASKEAAITTKTNARAGRIPKKGEEEASLRD